MERRHFNYNLTYLALGSLVLPHVACRSNNRQKEKLDLIEASIESIRNLLDNGDLKITDLTKFYLDRIKNIDQAGPRLNAIININPEALNIAEALDIELKDGKIRSPLHGIPVVIKDNIDTGDDMPTTAGSRAMQESFAPDDAFIVSKLRQAGAVILGKANLSEWANFRGRNSTSGWSGLGGLTKNPYILDRNTCGSSAGSGVAVSANLCVFAIGTETNGSIMCPSNANGIVGIKPTVGLISRDGIIPISSTQDTAGPMARTVTDAAIALSVLKGKDKNDPATDIRENDKPTDYTKHLNGNGLHGKRLGYFNSSRGINDNVDTLMDGAIEVMKKQGADIVEFDKISDDQVGEDSFNIMLFEYKEGLNKYFDSLGPNAKIQSLEELISFNLKDSVELQHFGQEYLMMAQKKGDLTSLEYKTALKRMLKATREKGIDKIMDELQLDAIISPSGSPAWKSDLVNGDNFSLGSSSPAARAGYPNICVPMGFINELPVCVSFFGRAWSESILIEIAFAYEQHSKHRRPPKFIST